MVNRIAGVFLVVCGILSISFLGLLSLFAPRTADNCLEKLRKWAELEK